MFAKCRPTETMSDKNAINVFKNIWRYIVRLFLLIPGFPLWLENICWFVFFANKIESENMVDTSGMWWYVDISPVVGNVLHFWMVGSKNKPLEKHLPLYFMAVFVHSRISIVIGKHLSVCLFRQQNWIGEDGWDCGHGMTCWFLVSGW